MAPASDASSLFAGRSGVLGRVIASASRDKRGSRNEDCNGGAEQHADASSGNVATTFPPKTTVLCDDMATMGIRVYGHGTLLATKRSKHEK